MDASSQCSTNDNTYPPSGSTCITIIENRSALPDEKNIEINNETPKKKYKTTLHSEISDCQLPSTSAQYPIRYYGIQNFFCGNNQQIAQSVAGMDSQSQTNITPMKKPETPTSKESFTAKPEDKKFNLRKLDCMKEIYENILKDSDKTKLLNETEIKTIKEFLELSDNKCHQYFLIELLLSGHEWYNHRDFCDQIGLVSPEIIKEIYSFLKEKQYIDTDLQVLDIDTLLNIVSKADLKKLCKEFKIDGTNSKDLIKVLKENCQTDLLKKGVLSILGMQLKLKEDIKAILMKAYFVQVFTNPKYIDPYQYFKDNLYSNVVYPDYKVENYSVFLNDKQYSRYYEAVSLKKNFQNAKKNDSKRMKILADEAFKKLLDISPDGKWPSYVSDHLRKFSAEYQYISILTAASEILLKFHENVKIWLEFLIRNYSAHYALGFWYKQLALIYKRYLKDSEGAANVIIEALKLDKEKNNFNMVQKYELSDLAAQIGKSRVKKVKKQLRDDLFELADTDVNIDNFVKITIPIGPIHVKPKVGKKLYYVNNEESNQNYVNAEIRALDHYGSIQYDGKREGGLLETLFVLLFWDIIYEYYVPNTFVSKYQDCPLDMFTRHFYANRKEEIDNRLKEIAEDWSQDNIESVLRDNWKVHSHEGCVTKLDGVSKNVEDLLKMFKCIKRNVLSKIFERLATDYKCCRSGLPDLFLCKYEISECKFVTVIAENENLSSEQKVWIQYLMDIKASVEVCHVSNKGITG